MNTKRIAPLIGAAAVLLALSGCAGVDAQATDTARVESSMMRAEVRLGEARAAAAAEVAEIVRGVKQAEARATQAEPRGTVDLAAQERIRSAKQHETAVATSVQERIRSAKQHESEPAPSAQPNRRGIKPAER
jgi:hypothetical protein